MSFSSQFNHFLVPTQAEVEDAIRTGVVVFDTNVLLNLYRFAPTARNELLAAFRKLGDRIFVPHQVGLEFHRNRLEVIADNREAYKVATASIAEHESSVVDELKEKIRQLSNRIALSESEKNRLLKAASGIFLPLTQELDEMRARHGLDDPLANDDILEQLQSIFANKVGSPFTEDEQRAALEEAARRNKEKIPPGYKDAPKHGDYFVWKQSLVGAANRSAKLLVFVTGDVKEDWYLRVQGKSLCARPELSEEAFRETGARLVLMRTETFLRHASNFLDAAVSPDTIRQAEELPDPEVTLAVREAGDKVGELRAWLSQVEMELNIIERRLVNARDEWSDVRSAISSSQASSEEERSELFAYSNQLQSQLRSLLDSRDNLTRQRAQVVASLSDAESLLAQIAPVNIRRALGG
ncbi:PIN domain-containing protein [Micromonospora sp. NPDC050686]|uniref:PIN-like domain-containing protein n=1 Tax=Micromonospora sp. NPDC050686 TaxID=3154631 RepID=UPI0033E38CCC